jgi:predicted DNA-binding transcriptional regulator AlpA
MDDRIIHEAERAQMTGLCRTTWNLEERAGRAPARRQLVGRRTGWLLSEIQDWIKGRVVANNPEPAAATAARRRSAALRRRRKLVVAEAK